MSEFALIERYFTQKAKQYIQRPDVLRGIGDDGAVTCVPPGQELITVIDTLIEGKHFPSNLPPEHIASRALAVNLSDLAAMGATPAWFTLALTIPETNPVWLAQFSDGLFNTAQQYGIQLIGGDTTQAPKTANNNTNDNTSNNTSGDNNGNKGLISVTIQACGFCPPKQALTRNTAMMGDNIYVSGVIGHGAIGLTDIQNRQLDTTSAKLFCQPPARITLGESLRGVANSCIDVSDGLLADCTHLMQQSGVSAELYLHDIPLADPSISKAQKALHLLSAGDDYELCFTVKATKSSRVELIAKQLDIQLTKIGKVTNKKAESSLILLDQDQQLVTIEHANLGYQHFGL